MLLKNEIIMIEVPQEVRVRKYEVDIPNLQQLLKESKRNSKITNKQIANALNIPLTKVEHWFRTDNCFAIPDENLWFDLKELLHITDNSFDEPIMTFEVREGVYEKSNRCYYEEGIAPTLTCMCGDEKIIIVENRYE
jgi:DNA (cytosine-5)-methyltransferase 1